MFSASRFATTLKSKRISVTPYQKVWLHGEDLVQTERTNAQQLIKVDLAVGGLNDLCRLVDGLGSLVTPTSSVSSDKNSKHD